MVSVTGNIKAEMARRDMTQEQLAKHLGISTNTLRYRLTGSRDFTLTEMESLAQLFSCSIDGLVGRNINQDVKREV